MFVDRSICTLPLPLAHWQDALQERTDAGGSRVYVGPGGEQLSSVTTIIGATKVDGPQLAAWKERQTDHELAEVEALRDEGAERGKMVHDLVETYLVARARGELLKRPDTPWWRWIWPALKQVDALAAAEIAVYHLGLGYAGRLDCLALWCGVPAVVDWKTKRAVLDGRGRPRRPRREWTFHQHDQIVAYVDALNEAGVLVDGKPIEAGILVHAIEGSDRPMIQELGPVELERARERWHDALDQYYLAA